MKNFFPLKSGKALKRLWGTVRPYLSMIFSGLASLVGLVGIICISFWLSIIPSVLSMGSLIVQYRDQKKQKAEMALINIRLQTSEIVAREVFDKPQYGGPIAKHYPPAPPTRTPPVKTTGNNP
jgi:hypothetical protein